MKINLQYLPGEITPEKVDERRDELLAAVAQGEWDPFQETPGGVHLATQGRGRQRISAALGEMPEIPAGEDDVEELFVRKEFIFSIWQDSRVNGEAPVEETAQHAVPLSEPCLFIVSPELGFVVFSVQ